MKQLFALLFARFNAGFIAFGPSKRTVEGALIHFNKAIDELNAVEEQENKEAAKQEQALTEASAALDAARTTATRARNKRAKIASLIGDDEESLDSIATLRNIKF
jgi:hypothetical protein